MFNYFITLLFGLPNSLSLMIAAVLIALVLALIFTTIIILNIPILSYLVKIYILVFTGTPFLIQLFLIYYGPGQFVDLYSPWVWSLLSQPWLCAMLALALNSTAYSTQLFVGAIRAIPLGQWHACTTLGMDKKQSLFVLMPLALKRSLNAYSNEIILVLKSTSLVYTITIMDVMGYSQLIYGRTYDIKVFIVTGIIYCLIILIIKILIHYIEQRILRFELHHNQ